MNTTDQASDIRETNTSAVILDTLPIDGEINPKLTPLIEMITTENLEKIIEFMGNDFFNKFKPVIVQPLSYFFASIPLSLIPLISDVNHRDWTSEEISTFVEYIMHKADSTKEKVKINGINAEIEIVGDFGSIILNSKFQITFETVYKFKFFFLALRDMIDDPHFKEYLYTALEIKDNNALTRELLSKLSDLGIKNSARAFEYIATECLPKLDEIFMSVQQNVTDWNGNPLKNGKRTIEAISAIVDKMLLGFGIAA